MDTKGRKIIWNIATLPDIFVDKKMIGLVWENLISNALKFTKNKEETIISIDVEKKASEYLFSIKDNGVGFDPKYTDKLFGVFQRLHSSHEFEGTGIGLSNIKKIISRHGGIVWIEGKKNQGATIYFTLPIL